MAPFPILIAALVVHRVLAAPVMAAIHQATALCAVVILALVHADTAWAADNLSPSPVDAHIDARMLIMAEPHAGSTPETVLAQPDTAWSPLDDPVLNFSFDQQAYWLKIAFTNPAQQPYSLVVDLGQPLQDYIDGWWFDGDHHVVQAWSTGDRRPDHARPLPYRAFAFPISVAAGSSATLLIRLDTHDGLYDAIPVSLFSYVEFYEYQQLENFWFGVYYGAIIILLLYNLIVGLALKSGNFLLYTLYLTSFLLWNLAFRGYFSYLSLPGGTWWHNEAVAVFSVAIFYSLTAFTLRFLELSRQTPRLRLALLASCVVMLYPLWLALTGHYSGMFSIFIPMAMINLVLILVIASSLSWRGQRSARIFLLAWGVLIVSAFAYYGRVYGILPSTWLTENALNIGSLIEMLVLALALADRIKQAELARLEDKNYLIRREKELNEALQQRVDEKTAELREINRKLATDSVTDALTGLLNRRSFHARLEDELRRASRSGTSLAFVLLDIDHFKALNDRHGHPEGDRVLKETGILLRSYWQRATDAIYRLGGEEFGIILTPASRQDLIGRVRELQERFQTEIRPADRTDAPDNEPLTLSAGVVLLDPDDRKDASAVYQLADQALYESKAGGRITPCD